MYEKYTTDALVLATHEHGEHDKTIVLYTRAFGLVYARASGVRKELSRMRGALQFGSHVSVSLIHGSRGWRATGTTALQTLTITPDHREGLVALARIYKLVRRLVHGEEQNEYLFETLLGARTHLLQNTVAIGTIELLCVARTLHGLGYLSAAAVGAACFADTAYAPQQLEEVGRIEKDLLKSVNTALAESQL